MDLSPSVSSTQSQAPNHPSNHPSYARSQEPPPRTARINHCMHAPSPSHPHHAAARHQSVRHGGPPRSRPHLPLCELHKIALQLTRTPHPPAPRRQSLQIPCNRPSTTARRLLLKARCTEDDIPVRIHGPHRQSSQVQCALHPSGGSTRNNRFLQSPRTSLHRFPTNTRRRHHRPRWQRRLHRREAAKRRKSPRDHAEQSLGSDQITTPNRVTAARSPDTQPTEVHSTNSRSTTFGINPAWCARPRNVRIALRPTSP